MTTATTVGELRRAVLIRADALTELADSLRGQLAASRGSLHAALGLAGLVPEVLRGAVDAVKTSSIAPNIEIQTLAALLRHLIMVLDFVETHLSHGTRRELSEALADEVRDELAALNVGDFQVVLSHGAANNYLTRCVDLSGGLVGPIARISGTPVPAPAKFAFFIVPRFEGAGVQWRPILLGHEVAHVAVAAHALLATFDLPSKFDTARATTLPNPAAPSAPPDRVAAGLYQIAQSWATELMCDMHALNRFGPAAAAALAEYFTCIGAMDQPSATHPPGFLRVRLLLDQIGDVSDARLQAVIAPWIDLVPPQINYPEAWVQYLVELFTTELPAISAAASTLPTKAYDFAARIPHIHHTADRLAAGVPGCEIGGGSPSAISVDDLLTRADAVNAAWLARVGGATTPFDRLAEKTLESIGFVTHWLSNGGSIPVQIHQRRDDTDEVLAAEAGVSVLAEDALLRRMQLQHNNKALTITPALQTPKGTGIDVRLGRRFIAFRRTAIASFDPISQEDDPRSIQVFVELSRKEQFVLHPQEVVLGATLEYLVVPEDLSGQVITRSSYGRLGLLSATAVQVHPGFRGCLTLELVNLSTIPITLTPGERIAQLILWKTGEVATSTVKYTYPIGPQFSLVRSDSEAETLRKLRS